MTPPDAPVVSVLIVTWNCHALIGPCLDHLFASRLGEAMEVVVVDNQSSDGTPDAVRQRPEPIILVESGANLGFGRGNNLAADHASGDYLLLLNPDAYLTDPDTLPRMLAALRAGEGKGHPGATKGLGAVAPRLNNPDGSHQIGDGGFAPTPTNVLRHVGLVSRALPGARGLYINHPALMRRERIVVDWLAATCLLVTRRAFDAVGGFDPRFFMYGEDVDLGVRMGQVGYQLELLPSIAAVHLQGATQRADPDAVHVSTGWIDAIFALNQGKGWRLSLSRRSIGATMMVGFGARALAYIALGKRGRAGAMWHYARHGWAGGINADRTRP